MRIYNSDGNAILVYADEILTPKQLKDSFEVTEESKPDYSLGKLVKTDGVSWWYEEPSMPAAKEPEPEDTETDIMSMTVDHEYRLTLLELGIETEV